MYVLIHIHIHVHMHIHVHIHIHTDHALLSDASTRSDAARRSAVSPNISSMASPVCVYVCMRWSCLAFITRPLSSQKSVKVRREGGVAAAGGMGERERTRRAKVVGGVSAHASVDQNNPASSSNAGTEIRETIADHEASPLTLT